MSPISKHVSYASSHLMTKEIKLGRSFVSYQWWIACCMHKYLAITHHISFTGYFLSRRPIKKLHTSILLMRMPGPCPGRLQCNYKPPICTLLRRACAISAHDLEDYGFLLPRMAHTMARHAAQFPRKIVKYWNTESPYFFSCVCATWVVCAEQHIM